MNLNEKNRSEYLARINRVIDHISTNLDKELTLDELARVASFSRYHFHRIFGAIMNETLYKFILRLRLEKAAGQLLGNQSKSITAVALDCGFSSSATFARAFKERYKESATQFRKRSTDNRNNCKTESNRCQTVSNERKEVLVSAMYLAGVDNKPTWRLTMTDAKTIEVEIKEFPEQPVVYVRHVGPYKGDGDLFERLFGKLMGWAGPRGLLGLPGVQPLCVYHDDPEITEESKLRTSVCVTVPPDTEVDGEIGKMTVPGGQFAVGHFELSSDDYEQAWAALMGEWMPQSGFQPDDRLCFELFKNNPEEHPEGKMVVDICVPVRPL